MLTSCGHQEVTSIEAQVKDLRNRICGLMLVIVDTVHGKELDDISKEIQKDIEALKWCVTHIDIRYFLPI